MAHHLRRLIGALPLLRPAAAAQGGESTIVAVGTEHALVSGRSGDANVVFVGDGYLGGLSFVPDTRN